MTLTALRSAGQVFRRMSLLEDNNYCRMFYPRVDKVWIWGRKMTEVKCQFHDVISKVRAVNFTLGMMLFSSDHLARVVFAKFFHYTLHFPYSFFGSKSLSAAIQGVGS